MEVAAELRKEAAPKWVKSMERTTAFLGGVLAAAHPATFATGMKCVEAIGTGKKVAKTENLEELMEIWSSPFTTMSLMSNRDSPQHRDTSATHICMD